MSLDLEKHLIFYGAYHSNAVNIAIHMVCVPLLLVSGFTLAASSGTVLPLPSWLTIPNLEPNLGTLAALTWGGLYILLEPVAGTALAALCLASAAGVNSLRAAGHAPALSRAALAVHVASWLLQFLGHGLFEGRAPALADNLLQAVFLAPLFVWLELLFRLGYRPELQARVQRAVAGEIAKFREQRAAEARKSR